MVRVTTDCGEHQLWLAVRVSIVALFLVGCQEKEADSSKACLTGYDSSRFDQCVAGCIKCEHGVTTTCSTSCTLKGARK